MGFGLLFVGYVLTFFLSLVPYGFIIRLAGYLLLAYALSKLYEYERKYLLPFFGAVLLILVGLVVLVRDGGAVLGINFPEWMSNDAGTIPRVELLSVAYFNLSLLYATAVFAKSLELQTQRAAALRNSVMFGLYFIIQFLWHFVFRDNAAFGKYAALPVFILQLLWIILISVMIFSCYMFICPEGDEDMPRKKTNIKLLDKILAESDRRFDKAMRETTEYYSDKIKNKIEKKKGNKNNRG